MADLEQDCRAMAEKLRANRYEVHGDCCNDSDEAVPCTSAICALEYEAETLLVTAADTLAALRAAVPAEPVKPLNHDGEPLHTGDDDRIDCVTSIRAALDGLEDEPDRAEAEEIHAGIRTACDELDALLIATIQREREAAVPAEETPARYTERDLLQMFSDGVDVARAYGDNAFHLWGEQLRRQFQRAFARMLRGEGQNVQPRAASSRVAPETPREEP